MILLFLLVAGLLFPAISFVTLILSAWTRWRAGRNSSAVLVPFVGPLLLTLWVLLTDHSRWWMLLAWCGDPGTMLLTSVAPRLVLDWWRHSRFTRILTLQGRRENQSVTLTLHTNGHYLLTINWDRVPGETGIIQRGEPGTYSPGPDGYELHAHHGLQRSLRRNGEGTFVVMVDAGKLEEELQEDALQGWTLK